MPARGDIDLMNDYRAGVLIDLDGTLVDSVYHHVLAWDDVFRAHGFEVPLYRVHAAIGMGGDRLIPWVLGTPHAEIAAMTSEQEQRFLARSQTLRTTAGAVELLDDLQERGVPHLLVTSATTTILDRLLAALGRTDVAIIHGGDVDSTKPSPDPVLAACAKLDVQPGRATLVGDSPWDAESAAKVGVRTLGVRTGGFSDAALLRAGASDVVDDPRALVGRL